MHPGPVSVEQDTLTPWTLRLFVVLSAAQVGGNTLH